MNEEPETNDHLGLAFLPDGRRIAVVLVGISSCLLSLYGSYTLVKLILTTRSAQRNNDNPISRQRRSKSTPLYHRLILGISCFDIFNTTGYLLAPFFLPSSTQLAWAVGNRATCTTSGLMNQFVIGSYVYFCALSLYYLGLVRYNLPEQTLHRCLEPTVHVLAIGLPLLQSVPAALLGTLNEGPLLGMCAQYPHPYECYGGLRNDQENPDLPPCTRGENEIVAAIGNVMVGLTVIFCVTAVFATWLVWWSVRQQNQRNQRYLHPHAEGSGSGGTSSSYLNTGSNHEPPPLVSQQSTVQARRAKAVANQAICYTLSVINLLFWFGLGSALEGHYWRQDEDAADMVQRLRTDNGYFAFMLCMWFGFPLQGWYNWMIYLRPRLLRWKDSHPELSWYGAYQQVLRADKAVPTSDRTAHLTHMHVAAEEEDPSSAVSRGENGEGQGTDETLPQIDENTS